MMMSSFPAQGAFDVTPSDAGPLPRSCRGLYIGFSGDVGVRTLDGNDVLFRNVAVGMFNVCCTHVFATGTTASGIVGLI